MTAFLAYLLTISGLRGVWVMIFGKAGDGKSAIVDAALKLIPDRYVVSGRITESSLMREANFKGTDFLDKKIVNFRDMGGEFNFKKWEATLDVIKELSTNGFIDKTIVSDGVDPVTGEKVNTSLELTGFPGATFSSVHSKNVQEQYESRGINLTPVATGKDVMKYRRYVKDGTNVSRYLEEDIEHYLELFKAWLELQILNIERYREEGIFSIINPYHLCLEKWIDDTPNVKRESEMFNLMLSLIVYLNKDKRQISSALDVMATKEDVLLLTELFKPSENLTEQEIKLYKRIAEKFKTLNYDEYEEYVNGNLQVRDAKTFFNVSTLKRRFKKDSKESKGKYAGMLMNLESEGWIEKMDEQDGRGQNIYYINEIKGDIKPIEFSEALIED